MAEPGRPGRVHPSWDDPVVVRASTAIGGPLGRHADTGRKWFWTPLRVLLALTLLTLALAWAKQAPCSDGDWTGSKQYTHFCYSDSIPLYGIHGLDEGLVPYAESPVEYPVLTGGFMYVAASLAAEYDAAAVTRGWLPDLPAVQTYYAVTCLLLALSALVVTWSVALLSRRRLWDAGMVALSPVLLVHAFTNWDLFAVALAGAALVAWSRERPVLAGVLLGLGAAAKLYPLFFLGPLLVLCWRTGRMRPWLLTTVAAGTAWLAVNVPVALRYPDNWIRFFDLNKIRPADPDSLWYITIHLGATFLNPLPSVDPAVQNPPTLLNLLTFLCFAAVCAGVAWLGLAAPRRPRLMQLVFLVVAGFLLTNKVWSPQFSLWLVPLAVLALPRWRPILIWQALEALVWVPRLLWYLGTDNNGIRVEWFMLAVSLRDAAVVVLMVLVVRDVLRPAGDVVRRDGVDDPAGGVLDGAPDVRTWRRRAEPAAEPVTEPV
ncbi:MAG: DUF2029 domain-containing protein [Geodermatophilaceae bacterium]|nr:DUF2029 domain-containing protein [Geodermatophilaceae bacterium]